MIPFGIFTIIEIVRLINSANDNRPVPRRLPPPTITRTNRYAKGISINKQILLDERGIQITAENYIKSTNDDFITIGIVNTSDEVVHVECSNVVVNGNFAYPKVIQTTVAPSTNQLGARLSLELGAWMLEIEGIRAFGQIDFHISVAGKEDSGMKTIEKDVSIRTSLYDHMDTEIINPGRVLTVCDGIRVSGKIVRKSPSISAAFHSIWLENISGTPKAVNFTYRCYSNGAEIHSSATGINLEDGRKSLALIILENGKAIEKTEGSLQVASAGSTELPMPEIFELQYIN